MLLFEVYIIYMQNAILKVLSFRMTHSVYTAVLSAIFL